MIIKSIRVHVGIPLLAASALTLETLKHKLNMEMLPAGVQITTEDKRVHFIPFTNITTMELTPEPVVEVQAKKK